MVIVQFKKISVQGELQFKGVSVQGEARFKRSSVQKESKDGIDCKKVCASV